MRVAFEIQNTLDVVSRGQTVTFDLAVVPDEKIGAFLAQAALHGLKQAIGDAAAGAAKLAEAADEDRTPEQIAFDLMKSKCTALAQGDWSQRRERIPLDPVGARAWKLALDVIKDNLPLAAKYKEMDKDGKTGLRKAVFEKYEDKLRAKAKKLIELEGKTADEIDLAGLL